MAIKSNSRDWTIQPGATTRGAGASISGLPRAFVPEGAETEEVIAAPRPAIRGAAAAPTALDISVDLAPDEAAVLAVRHPSGALTFHAPRESTRTRGGPAEARFVVPVRPAAPGERLATRGIVTTAIKAVVVTITKKVADKILGDLADKASGFILSKLAAGFESAVWQRKGLKEGWLKVTQDSLAAGRLKPRVPSSAERSLLFIHGTFSNAMSAYGSLAASSFFEDVRPLYGDRVFAFDHFTISRSPEENARMLLSALPNETFTFDVITHSRGGLVLRNLAERSATFGPLASRFALGRAILVAAPNEGTPLAMPTRWQEAVGWVANLLELFPDNPFTTGAEFVANGLVWIAKHASGDLPGLRSMDGDGDLIRELQSPPGPPPDRYSVLAANYLPSGSVLARLLDAGIDQFFNTANDLVVPSEGGWRVDPSGGSFIPGARIGCFGPGGNISKADVTHVNFFAQPETVRFLVAALQDQPHKLPLLDPAAQLPDRRLIRSGAPGISAPATGAGGRPAAPMRARMRGPAAAAPAAEPIDRLRIAVANGDLTFEERPLLIGHYRATQLTGAEKVIDKVLQNTMTSSLNRGVYPLEPGTHRIFVNQHVQKGRFWQTPRPEAVIVAGLGQEGKLQSAHVVQTVRQAVIAWAERVAERGAKVNKLSLAATLLASGGTGVSPGQSAQLVVQGVLEANSVIRKSQEISRIPEIGELRFVELYLNRATEAWEAVKMLAHASPDRFTIVEPIVEGTGSLRRPLASGYRGADYDFITAETRTDANGNPLIAYALDTRRARTEVQAQATQGRLLRDLIATASTDANVDERISRTLYNLLVPIELEAFLADSGETQIEVDKGTAGIPWELITDSSSSRTERAPWAIRSKLLRKFRTETYRAHVNDADVDGSILVIGEPQCPPDYPALPGALVEAKDVVTLLKSDPGLDSSNITGLFAGGDLADAPDSRQVIDALYERSWRIVHIAGHGEPENQKGNRGGVVLSNDTFLGATEIKGMRVVPELVFVNCCHLAASPRRSLLREPKHGFYDRAAFASGVAQALIEIGVRSVVAAGWAVDDAAASAFATTFYQALLRGERFIEAVALARAKAFEFAGNTWAAYQCYGDPDWRFRRHSEWSQEPRRAQEDEFDLIASVPALRRALETISVQSSFQGFDAGYQLDRLQRLEQRWAKMGWKAADDLADLFASAYAAAGDLASAIRWYEAAIEAADGKTSFRSLEQLSNLRIRKAMQDVRSAAGAYESLVSHRPEPPQRGGARSSHARSSRSRQLADARRARRAAIISARATIKAEIARIEQLTEFEETMERSDILGAAMKRLSELEKLDGRAAAARRAVEGMARYYRRGLDLAHERNADNLFYPAINVVAAELVLGDPSRKKRQTQLPASLFDDARRSIKAKNKQSPDFWTLVAEPQLRLYEGLLKATIIKEAPAVVRELRDVHRRSQGTAQWSSVEDTLRFVLDPYLKRAGKKAGHAARSVLAEIEKLAKPASTEGESGLFVVDPELGRDRSKPRVGGPEIHASDEGRRQRP
jgi:CHAT domain-containing protein